MKSRTSTKIRSYFAVAFLGLLAYGQANVAGASEAVHIAPAIKKAMKGTVMLSVTKQSDYGSRNVAAAGVIVDPRGYIVTNHHVVDGGTTFGVRLFDGTRLDATLVVAKENADLAILKVQTGHQLTALPLGEDSDVYVGERVFVIGNPYGYADTVTGGIVSALDRDIEMPSGAELRHLIQTDAAINPGNSGGALITENGDFIGVACALREGATGIGFIIPASSVRDFLRDNLPSK